MRRFRRSSLGSSPKAPSIGAHAIWIVSPLLLAITVLGRSSQNMAQTTYPLVGRELLGLTSTTIGLITAAAGVTGVLASALVVPRITPGSRLWFLAVGQVLGLTAFVLFAISNDRADIWIGAVSLGMGAGLIFPILMTVIGTGKREDRAKALALFALALSASLMIGPLLEAGVLHLLHNSLRGTFAVLLPLPAAATAAAIAAALRERPPDTATGVAPPLPGVDQVGLRPRPMTASPEGLFRSTSRIALLTMLTYQAPFAALVAFGGLLARYADHASATDVELAFGSFFGVSLAVRALVTLWSPIARQTEVLIASALATMAGVAVLGAASGLPALFTAMAILGAPHGVTFPLASSILAEHIPNEQLGRANGRLMAGTNALSVAVPFVCGWLIDAVGYRSTFLLLEVPVTGFVGLLVLALVRTPLTSIPVSVAPGDEEPPDWGHMPG